MNRLQVLLWKEFRLNLKLWLSVIVGMTVLGMASVLVTVLMPSIVPEDYRAMIPEPSPKMALSDCIENLYQIGGLVAIILASTSIPSEAEKGTMDLILSRPVRPWEVIASKHLSILVVVSIAVYVSALSTWAYSHVLGSYPLGKVILAAVYVGITLKVVASLSILIGALFKGQVAAITCSIALNMALALSKTLVQQHSILYNAHPLACIGVAYKLMEISSLQISQMLTPILYSASYILLLFTLSTLTFKWRFEIATYKPNKPEFPSRLSQEVNIPERNSSREVSRTLIFGRTA